MEDWSKFLALGLDAAFVGLMYLLYKQRVKDAEAVQHAPSYSAQSEELYKALMDAPDKTLPYACVEGSVSPIGPPLKSQFTDNQGVIQRIQFIEHRMKRVQGFWGEEMKVLRDVINSTLFRLVDPADHSGSRTKPPVDVQDALSANFLQDSLTTVYDVYDPTKEGFLSRSVDRIFGEMTKGFQQKELMLTVGAPVLGIGRLTMSSNDSRIQLVPPGEGNRYIITSAGRADVVRLLKKDARTLKIFWFLFGGIGVVLALHLLYKYISKWKSLADFKRRLAEVKRARMNNPTDEAGSTENACVICLTNRREIIVLDCGHVCLCASCSQEFSQPARCPVCRAPVTRFMPVYMP